MMSKLETNEKENKKLNGPISFFSRRKQEQEQTMVNKSILDFLSSINASDVERKQYNLFELIGNIISINFQYNLDTNIRFSQ